MHAHLISIVLQAIAFGCFGLSVGNFSRLQSAEDAPSIGTMAIYVGLPAVFGLLAIAGVVYQFVIDLNSKHNPPRGPNPPPSAPESAAVLIPRQPDGDMSAVSQLIPPVSDHEKLARDRLRIWSIIDELSDALRDDQAGSEALSTVRERYHTLQFSPSEHDPGGEQASQPVAKARLAA